MKNLKAQLLSAGLAMVAVCSSTAQTVNQIILGRNNEFVQTDATTVVINPAPTTSTYGGPYGFGVEVKGSGLTTDITVTFPSGYSNATQNPTQHNGGVLGYVEDDDAYKYGFPNFNNIGMTSFANRNSLFPFGTYTVSSSEFTSVPLTLAAPANSFTPPTFTLTGGTWSGGVYLVNPTSTVTISTSSSAFAAFNQNADGGIVFAIADNNDNFITGSGQPRFYSSDTGAPNYISYTIAANTLTAGFDYTVFGSYIAIVDKNTINGSFNAAFIEASTQFTIQAIPEPSTYAALAGLGALWLAVWRRRQRVTAV
jgi:hypothetical protein